MSKWDSRAKEKVISESVIHKLPTEKLLVAKEFIELFQKYKSLNTIKKTYINGIKKAVEYNQEEKVYVDFKFEGTRTGRLSCGRYNAGKGKPKGVSFHTLSKEDDYNVRSIFVAPPGYAFVTLDYSTMELRILSEVANEEVMARAFEEDKDLHTYAASIVFNKPEKDIDKKSKERTLAKTCSFLIVYGGGAMNLSETAGLSVPKAQRIIDAYFKTFPELRRYLRDVEEKIKRDKHIDTIFGRRRHLPDIDSKTKSIQQKALRQGLNFTVQSPASDTLLCCLLAMQREFNRRNLRASIIACVHDSIELIVKFEDIKDVLEEAYDQMVNYPIIRKTFGINFNVPLKVDGGVGLDFGDQKDILFSEGGKVLNLKEIYKFLVEKSTKETI